MGRDPMGPPPPDREVDRPSGAPSRLRYSTIPPVWISGIDRVPDIEVAISALSVGNLRMAALLADAAMRDERIWAVMDTRAGVIRGADVEVKPADASGKAADVAQVLGGNEDATGLWSSMFPPQTIARILRYGWLCGISVAEVVWLPLTIGGERMWFPRLVPVHPQFTYWDWGYRAYRLTLQEGTITLPDVSAQPFSDGKWFVWCPFGYQYAWGEAMIKPLADLYLRRRWNARDWARYNEKHGSLADLVYVPEDAEENDKMAYFYDVANRGADSAVMVPRRDGQSKDSGYGLEILEPKGRSWETFVSTQEKLDNATAILFWGQNLTTEIQKGAGSKAAEQGHQKVADIKTQEDAAIADALGQQVVSWWAHYNFGSPDLAPRARYAVEPPVDTTEEGAGLKAIGDGVQSLVAANPKTDVDALYDAHGIPMRSDAEMAEIERQKREAAAAATPPQGPDGGQGGGAPAGGGKGAPGGQPAAGAQGGEAAPGKKAATARLKNDGSQVVGRRSFQGFGIAIENAAGTTRFWHDADGQETGRTEMKHDYGYFEDHGGTDDEGLDVYLGSNENAPYVYVVKQMRGPDFKRADEDKVFLGFDSEAAARAAYAAHRNDGQRAIGGVTSLTLEQFRTKLARRRGKGHVTARGRERTATLRLGGPAYGKARTRRQRLYADGVVESGKRTAKKAMASYLHRVLAAVRGAHSYEEMKQRVLHEFRHVRPDELAAIVARARIMAKAGGMDTAWQQV
jgi:phage gp29-like protein